MSTSHWPSRKSSDPDDRIFWLWWDYMAEYLFVMYRINDRLNELIFVLQVGAPWEW